MGGDNERYEICRTYFLRPGVYCRLILFLPRRITKREKGLALLVYNAIDGINFAKGLALISRESDFATINSFSAEDSKRLVRDR